MTPPSVLIQTPPPALPKETARIESVGPAG